MSPLPYSSVLFTVNAATYRAQVESELGARSDGPFVSKLHVAVESYCEGASPERRTRSDSSHTDASAGAIGAARR